MNLIRIFFLIIILYSNLHAYNQGFTDVTLQSGINVISPALGDAVVWIDHNQDGWPDFFGSSDEEVFFFENNGDGTFSNISAQSGLQLTYPAGMAVADFDQDGYPDLLITSTHINIPVSVYKNNSGNGFSLAFAAGESAERAIWLDYNYDGYLDFFCNTGGYPHLYENDGNGNFINVATSMNFNVNSGSTSAAADYDNDGLIDLYCTAFSGTNRLYKNVAGEKFEDVTFQAQVSDYRQGVAQCWGDYNGDGWLDLYIGNIGSNRNVLFRNAGDGTFEDVTNAAGVADVGDARTCTWIDVDNDGLVDLFTTNHVNPNRLYINNGDETFTDQALVLNIDSPQDGFGVSWADYDRDGDLDVLIAGHSYSVKLMRNDLLNLGNFLDISLSGTNDNENGIGARIQIFYDNVAKIAEVNGGTGSVCQDQIPVHFGLANYFIIDSILVKWPGGMEQRVWDITADQRIVIQQQGNTPPRGFHLLQPLPDSIVGGQHVTFVWGSTFDPDSSHQILYQLYIQNPENDTAIGPLTDTSVIIPMSFWMENDSTSWYVVATDNWSARHSWETWPLNYSGQVGIIDDKWLFEPQVKLIRIFPNPALDQFFVEIWAKKPTLAEISLIDEKGAVLVAKQFEIVTGDNCFYFNTDSMRNGIYLICVRAPGCEQCRKISLN